MTDSHANSSTFGVLAVVTGFPAFAAIVGLFDPPPLLAG